MYTFNGIVNPELLHYYFSTFIQKYMYTLMH